jgi:hypothetical protein
LEARFGKLAYDAKLEIRFCFQQVPVMGLGKRAAVYVARPIYRKLFERPLWWFLAKVKVFFLAEISQRILMIENKLDKLEKLGSIEECLRSAEVSNVAQWDAIEQLLLAIIRQPELRRAHLEEDLGSFQNTSTATELNRVNDPNNIR